MKLRKHKKNIIPLPYPYYFFPVAAVALAGLFDSIYLAVSHFRVYTDMGYQSFCAISRTFNCDTVSQSPYSILLGVPVPVWGIIGYVFFLLLLMLAWPSKAQNKRIWALLFIVSLAYNAYSIVLAVISTYMIHSYCIMCILSYAINLMLLFFTWLVCKRFHCESFFKAIIFDIRYLLSYPKLSSAGALFLSTGVVLLVLFFPAYWHMTSPALAKNMPTGFTEDGHPWIGASNPDLVIVEFSDYRCFQCKKMHYFLRRLVQDHPNTFRLVHRHFPMDHTINPLVKHPFHNGSAKLAIVSIFAAKKEKFWEMNDILFDISRQTEAINIRDLAEKAGMEYDDIKYVFRDNELWHELKTDIRAGIEHGLTGTPGFVINDQVYLGQIPAEVLRRYGNF